MRYYPAFLDLKGKKAAVVGGGTVAERKIRVLLKAGALVTVVSPALTSWLASKAKTGAILHISRSYRKADLRGSFVVIAATDDVKVNSRVSKDATVPVNVVDTPFECSFILPSLVQRGPLTLAISTSGASPALARSLRKELEAIYGKEFKSYLDYLAKVRRDAMQLLPDPRRRAAFLKWLGSAEMLAKFRKEGLSVVRDLVLSRLRKESSRCRKAFLRGSCS